MHSLKLSPGFLSPLVKQEKEKTKQPLIYFFPLESYTFVEEVIECFQNTVSIEELHFLLTDHEAWRRFVAEATLSR